MIRVSWSGSLIRVPVRSLPTAVLRLPTQKSPILLEHDFSCRKPTAIAIRRHHEPHEIGKG